MAKCKSPHRIPRIKGDSEREDSTLNLVGILGALLNSSIAECAHALKLADLPHGISGARDYIPINNENLSMISNLIQSEPQKSTSFRY